MIQSFIAQASLLLQPADIPFSREYATRKLPWVIAVMVALVGLLLTAGISLHQASERSGKLNLHSFQVYLPYGSDVSMSNEITALLEGRDEVRLVERLAKNTLEELVMPWTSGELAIDDLPLPIVLEVTLHRHASRGQAIADIEALLKTRNEAIDVESYQDWVEQLTQFTNMLRLGAFVLVALLFGALMALVAIVVRTSLMLHFHAVRLLHHLGARDDYIIRQFVANACLMVLKGSAMGMGVASMLAVAVSYFSIENASPILPEIVLGGLHVVMLIVLPLMMVAMTALLVRVTILQMLGKIH